MATLSGGKNWRFSPMMLLLASDLTGGITAQDITAYTFAVAAMIASHPPRNLPIMASILAQNIARFILVMRQSGQKREFWRIWIGYARLAGAGSWAMFSICARRAVCLSIRLPNFKAGR